VYVFEKIVQEIPAKLILIGDGPERTAIEKISRELAICDQIRFLGKQEAIEEILSVTDLFIMPSESESFGLAALEAMACQVPVISTNTGGMPELNVQGVTGFMSNVGDIKDMAKNAIYVLSDHARLTQFKANALARAKEFDINVIMPMYERYYQRVLEGEEVRS
jgi:N-acetyl-alpha-D-glucosaminyl L-malate synthase BshA